MGIFKLLLPKMGESVSEATLTKWLKAVGDTIEEDEAVVEIATDKVDSEVPSPVKGVLKEILFETGKVVQVDEVIAYITVEVEDETDQQENTPPISEPSIEEELIEVPGIADLTAKEPEAREQSSSNDRFYSPLVKSIAKQEGLEQDELHRITGSGVDNRVTKQDVLAYIESRETSNPTSKPIAVESERTSPSRQTVVEEPKKADTVPVKIVHSSNDDEIIEMDRMRRLIADHMVHSVQTSPHVFSVVEADVTELVRWRNQIKDPFKKREGENITFTPIFIEAIAKALKDFPMINVSVDGYNIIKRKHFNIGMASALPSGNLIVPVIKDVDQLNLLGLTKAVNDLALRSKENKLRPDDTQGGTFTFTNIGAFGNIFGMPIINQPQAAILAVGTITKKPAVVDTEYGDIIAIRHKMYLTMSYDHRVIDGALGGSFIRRVADYLENWDKNREI